MKRQPITITAPRLSKQQIVGIMRRAEQWSRVATSSAAALMLACYFRPREQVAAQDWLREHMGVPLDLYRVPLRSAWLLFGLAALVAQEAV